jgi:hypothetical protein
MPSQRTSAANSGSAQAIDSSAYTRDTPSNIREETAVNQSLHPGFTAPVHGTPPLPSLPVPVPAVSSQRAEIMPTLRPQCYTDNPGASPRLSSGQIEGATSGIADRQIRTLPPLQEMTGQSVGRHTPARFTTPYETTTENLTLPHGASAYLFGESDQPVMAIGAHSASAAPNADNSWLDDYSLSWFDDFEQPYNYG